MRDLPDRALSIRQPWAWAIINAGKNIENRTWETLRRGQICIHAAKGITWSEWDDAVSAMLHICSALPKRGDVARGGIIGTAEIVDCVRTHESPWFFGPFGIVLANVQPVEFIPVKGALGFFDWRKNLKEARHG